MSMPMYVSPDQLMKDRAEFARKGISRGRSAITARYRDGIVFIAENPSHTLHKVSEIHDRIGFAAVGRYHEFESLRVAGIRYADMRGYAYDPADVTARALANSYAQVLGTSFSSAAAKPFEVELVVAQLGDRPESASETGTASEGDQTGSMPRDGDGDRLYRINFDGLVSDEGDVSVIGGNAAAVLAAVREDYDPSLSLARLLRLAVPALRAGREATVDAGGVEVALLERSRLPRRCFVRLDAAQVDTAMREDS